MAGFFDFFRRRESSGSRPAPSAAIRDLAFSEIKKTWSAEESDITEQENGFDWLPASHNVHVRILREEEGDDPSRHRLWVTTEFLHSVGSDEKTAVDIATLTPVICPTFSPVRWTKGGSGSGPTNLQFFSSVYVSDDNVGAFSSLLARMSVLQPFMAERAADDFGNFLRGTPALATGSKRQTESVVSHIGDMVRGKSDGISDWTGSPEFEAFVEQYAQNDDCFGTADRTGMALEIPLGSDSVLIRFETKGAFPGLGNGLLVRTMIRSNDTPDQICSLAALLNGFEGTQWTDFAQLGCWHLHSLSESMSVLAHSCFIPNMFFGDGLVTNYGIWAIARALWVREILLPDAQHKTMAEILKARHGL
jgi:hypothetical protein